jgi:putative ABC transport system permease protein
MFRNYLITALRNLARHRLYSFINIGGLAVGLACAIFILLFLLDELSYDRWIPGSENVYRVELTMVYPSRVPIITVLAPFQVPLAMREQIPGVTAMSRLIREGVVITIGDKQFSENFAAVDQEFLQMVRLPLIEGDPATALARPDSVLLSQTTARKYFGDEKALGRRVVTMVSRCDSGGVDCKKVAYTMTITGILRDLPHNTQLQFDALMPNTSQADSLPQAEKDSWTNIDGWGYVQLAPGTDPKAVLAKLNVLIAKNANPNAMPGLRGGETNKYRLTPFREMHLPPPSPYDAVPGAIHPPDIKPAGSWAMVYGFAAILVLILLVACFNFTNLATTRAALRAKEIALRKCLGATRKQLIVQFLGESVLMALLSLTIALALVEMLTPLYDGFLDRPIALHYLADWSLMLAIIAIAIIAGLLSGLYPALVLSSFRPVSALRANSSRVSGRGLLRSGLVVMQFAVSIGLGIAVLVVFSQINYARHMDLGFQRDGIIAIGGFRMPPSAREGFANALRADPRIADVSRSNVVPFQRQLNTHTVRLPGETQSFNINNSYLDPEYPRLYKIPLLAGRLLSEDRGEDRLVHADKAENAKLNDGRNILINATAAKRFGFTPELAIGKTIILNGARTFIVGVLGDAKVAGAQDAVEPFVYTYAPEFNTMFSVRLRGNDISGVSVFMEKLGKQFLPGAPLQHFFLDDIYDQLFREDTRQGTMFGIFVGVAIFIACLGLFGLAAFSAARRTREIGIRKVFGARTRDIVWLLMWQFSIPVLLANLLAWPLAYYYLHHWLEGYAYHIALNPLYFLAAGGVALLIAWATVFAHVERVARANPIHALRHE